MYLRKCYFESLHLAHSLALLLLSLFPLPLTAITATGEFGALKVYLHTHTHSHIHTHWHTTHTTRTHTHTHAHSTHSTHKSKGLPREGSRGGLWRLAIDHWAHRGKLVDGSGMVSCLYFILFYLLFYQTLLFFSFKTSGKFETSSSFSILGLMQAGWFLIDNLIKVDKLDFRGFATHIRGSRLC